MRHLISGVMAGCFLALPAFAQSAAPPATAKPPAAQPAQNGTAQTQPDGKTAKPADPAPKDDSMTNYDVNGSNASDAMGGAP